RVPVRDPRSQENNSTRRRLFGRWAGAKFYVYHRSGAEAGVHRGYPPAEHARAFAVQGIDGGVLRSRRVSFLPLLASEAGGSECEHECRCSFSRVRKGATESGVVRSEPPLGDRSP